jgi:hypothetical protein
MRSRIPLAALIALSAVIGCDQQPVAPDTDWVAEAPLYAPHGNANKFVWAFQFNWTTTCSGGQELDVDFSGTGQFTLHKGKRNVELNVWHNTWLYTNTAGDTVRWIDTGPDRFYYNDDGDLIITVTGTSTASGPGRDQVNVGTMVFNIDTDEVEFTAGQGLGYLDDMACEELT